MSILKLLSILAWVNGLILLLIRCSNEDNHSEDLPKASHLSATASNDFLSSHNEKRLNHCTQAMTWNPKLASTAQMWTDYLAKYNACGLSHQEVANDQGEGLIIKNKIKEILSIKPGENLAGLSFYNDSFSEIDPNNVDTADIWASISAKNYPVEMWYSEVGSVGDAAQEVTFDYNACKENDGNDFLVIGHLTQMLWDETSEVGCGLSFCENSISATGSHQVVVACHYSPPGNFPDFLEHVLPPKPSCQNPAC